MLSWICPDCGCDCAPTDNECPDCADLVQAGMLALARAVQSHAITAPPPPEIPLQDPVAIVFAPIAPRPAQPLELRPAQLDLQAPAQAAPLIPLSSGGMAEAPVAAAPIPTVQAETAVVPTRAVAKQAPPSAAKRTKVPGWLLSLVVATLLSLGGAAIVRNMAEQGNNEPRAAARPHTPSSPQAAFIPYVEITGLRVMVDLKNTSQLRYIIVNHSSTLLSNLSLRVSVHSGSASKPLFTISAVVTGLAPYESREMVAEIDDLASKNIPEWDHLKPVVQVIAQ